MRILICSDGTPSGDNASRLGGLVAAASRAETVLLGIAEKRQDEPALRDALEHEAQSFRGHGITPEIVMRAGEPVRQILKQTAATTYDLVVIGARQAGHDGPYWRSMRTYELVKAISPPVLVAVGDCVALKKFLVCTGGKEFFYGAVRLTGKLAAALGSSVTLLHVLAEPPAIYSDLVRLEEDVDLLLGSHSELGENLRLQASELERMNVPAEVRVRHGIVLDQVFAEAREGDYDLIVTGSSEARGVLRHYVMGDLTRSILNRADCPVLVARTHALKAGAGFWNSFKRLFVPGGA